MTTLCGIPLIPGSAEGELILSTQPLSFWGGVDPKTGRVIDQRHELYSQSTAGKILAFPGSKGSSTGSEVLLEAVMNKVAPAGILVTRQEIILTLGAILAEYLYQVKLPIIKITEAELIELAEAAQVRINADGMIEIVKDRNLFPQKGIINHDWEQKMANRMNGVYIPVFTSYDKDDKVNEEALRFHCRYLLDECKVQGLIPCGSTGGFAFMHDDEREFVIKTVLEEAKGKGEVYAGAAACATRDVVRYSKDAMRWGADGVMIVPPYYGGFSQEELFQHYKAVAEGVPESRIILYNNPFTCHSDILPETVERLAEFDNIIAIKETTGIMQRVKDIQYRVGNKIEVVCGCDTLPFEFFLCGVTAWISGPGNLLAKQAEMLYQLAVVQKDYEQADAYFKDVRPAFEIIENGPYLAMVIAGIGWRGHPVGVARKPVLPLAQEYVEPLRQELKRLGYKAE